PKFSGMPHIPDPMQDLLPPQVRQMMGMIGGASSDGSRRDDRIDLAFPALRDLPGWAELPESKQKMFEVEAAQLHASGHFSFDDSGAEASHAGSAIATERALAALTVHPKISATLKR